MIMWVRVNPSASVATRFKCGLLFTKNYRRIDVDAATRAVIIADQYLGYSDVDPGLPPPAYPDPAPLKVKQAASLPARPTAAAFGSGQCQITTELYSIISISNGVDWYSYGNSALLSSRPTPAEFGVGQWVVGEDVYVSDGVAFNLLRHKVRSTPVRIVTLGDSTANIGDINKPDGTSLDMDVSICTAPYGAAGDLVQLVQAIDKFATYLNYPMAYLVGNGGIPGENTSQIIARDTAVIAAGSFTIGATYKIVDAGNTDFTLIGSANNRVGTQFKATGIGSGTGVAKSIYRKSIKDIIDLKPDAVFYRGGSINDLYFSSTITPANWQQKADETFDRHIKIVSKLASSGVLIFDHMFFGMGLSDGSEGTAVVGAGCTYPDHVRQAIIYLIGKIERYFAGRGNVITINPVGLLCDSTGRFLPGMTKDGVHLELRAIFAFEKHLGKLLTKSYGESKKIRYDGLNLFRDPLLSTTVAESYGTRCTSISIGVSGVGNRQNAAVEPLVFDDEERLYQSCELAVGAAMGGLQFMFANPIISGAYPANTVFGIEVSFFVKSLDAVPRKITNLYFRFETIKNGAGRVIIGCIPNSVNMDLDQNGYHGHLVIPPFKIQEITSNLSTATINLILEVTGGAGVIKAGVTSIRLIEL